MTAKKFGGNLKGVSKLKKNQTIKTILFCSILLFLSLFILSSNPISAESSTIFVDDDADPGWYNETQVHTIQEGVNNVTEGGTINVVNGHYPEDTYLDKTVTITGESSEGVWVNGNIYVTANGTIIENITIANVSEGDFPCGIYDESTHSLYRNLHLFNNSYGIRLTSSSYNTTITNNIIENSSQTGVYLEDSQDNIICHNHIINLDEGATGIYLSSSDGNTIYDNYLENYYNVYENGDNQWNISLIDSIDGNEVNIIGGEWFGGNYWSDYSGTDMYSGPEQDILGADGIIDMPYDEPEVLIDYYPLTYNYNQLYVDDDADPGWYDITHVHTIQEAVNNASFGATIYVYNGFYPLITFVDKKVRINGESVDGVLVTDTIVVSNDFTIIENLTIANISTTGDYQAGIYDESSNSTYRNLHIFNSIYGIRLSESAGGTSISNSVIENNSYGIYSEFIDLNIIFNNYLINNDIGLMLNFSSLNLIYNNYFDNEINIEIITEGFIENSFNLPETMPSENIIGGSYLGGNYWNYYTGSDIDADGIGDEPYLVYSAWENEYFDFFPLTDNSNTPPTLGTPTPTDESANNALELDWIIPITDNDGWMSWNISCNNGQYNQSSEDTNGTKTLHLTNLAYSTTYTINVNATDWHLWTEQTFTFTTKNKPQEKKPAQNQPPVARSGGSYAGHPNERITFNGENSYDPDGYITSYSWSFGDGATAQGEIVSHTYTSQGSYTVTLVVTDDKGKTDSSQSTVVIVKANNPPEIQSSANINPGELSTQLTVTVTDKDGDDISGTISWDDGESTAISLSAGQTITRSHTYGDYGSYSIKISANDGTTTSSKTHTISLFTTEEDDSSSQGIGGFSKITTKDEDFIENNIEERSVFGQAVDNKYVVIPAATAASILLLFLLNLLVEFLSDYSSEHVLDHKRDKQKKKKQQTAQKTFLNKKELLAVFVTTILLALVLTYTWVPDLSMFWSLFVITLVIVAVIILIRETIRCYLCRKHNIQSEFYIWPLGGIMMIVSTLIGNTFSLAANHHYEDNGNIKQCGKVNFTVALFMYIVVASAFIINLFYNSIILQMIVIVTILNLFIDLFPFKPMDGYETRKWNLPLWAVLYVIVFVSYVVVYFNLYP